MGPCSIQYQAHSHVCSARRAYYRSNSIKSLAKLGQKMWHGRDDTDQLDEGRIGEQNEQM